jgi:hypothetical protein
MSVALLEIQRMPPDAARRKHSLMLLVPKDYRGLGDKIISVSVKPLTHG